MRTQIMVGILAQLAAQDRADVVYALNAPRFSFNDLYRLVECVSRRHGVMTEVYLTEDGEWDALIEHLHNAYAYNCDTDGWVVLDNGNACVDEDYIPCDWQTVVLVSEEAAQMLLSHTCETVFYNEATCDYVWAIPFFNNNWSVVSACMF